MAEILLTSESFLRDKTNVSDNLSGKYVLSAIREAQEIGLKGITGACLLEALKEMVQDGSISDTGNAAYKALLGLAQYYLAYSAIVETVVKVSYKVGNFGVAQTHDENMTVAAWDDVVKMRWYYQSKADAYAHDLQVFLLDNRAAFPELSECQCGKIRANLRSSATCGVFLGGARGKRRAGR